MKTRGFNLLSWAALSLALVLFDQYTKLLAVAHLKGKTPFVILDGVFELLYSENRGAAFGMLQGKQGFFFVIGTVVVAAAIYVMWRMPGWSSLRYLGLRMCTILITAGALGNMVDRTTQGYVVDFLYRRPLQLLKIDFPIFNVADICVTTSRSTAALASALKIPLLFL